MQLVNWIIMTCHTDVTKQYSNIYKKGVIPKQDYAEEDRSEKIDEVLLRLKQ